ncbi:hypothetical protein GH714_013201 [Hevea brasiliensis]|uniref:Uncharacterized protein n=1 Tax=Hevea brasiliensis TaxID=3981 RepID=A0A6A6KPJ8_HEVBR|nr:hypothetical protein GH714_013201 [Hevea brasiliensis]
MESSKTLTSLPQEGQEDEKHEGGEHKETQKPSVSAFAFVPHRPPATQYFMCIWQEKKDLLFLSSWGGYSGLSLALSANKIKEKARVVAIDLRGHGKTSTENDLDLSIGTMCNDVLAVLKEMNGESPLAIVLVVTGCTSSVS